MPSQRTRPAAEKPRCPWVNPANPLYVAYHDREWGRRVRDDRTLFEFLILEGAQAGLSWETILKKRENYRRAFAGFDPRKVAKMGTRDFTRLMADEGIVRNRLKIDSTFSNARAFLAVQAEFGSFYDYLRTICGPKTLIKRPRERGDFVARDETSDRLSKDLKKRGFRFVGSTIMYAYLQATGFIDEHAHGCYRATAGR